MNLKLHDTKCFVHTCRVTQGIHTEWMGKQLNKARCNSDSSYVRLDLLTYNHQCAMLQLLVPPISKVEHDHTYAHSSCHEQLSGSQNSLMVNTDTEFKLTSAIKEHIITELTVTTIERQDIEQRTRQQSNSVLWHQVRARRITGSKCGRILCAKKYTENLLLSLLYPRPMCYPPRPIEWAGLE